MSPSPASAPLAPDRGLTVTAPQPVPPTLAQCGKRLRQMCVKGNAASMRDYLDELERAHGAEFVFSVLQAGNRNGKMAVHFACQLTHSADLLELLIQRAANVNACTVRGHTPLLYYLPMHVHRRRFLAATRNWLVSSVAAIAIGIKLVFDRSIRFAAGRGRSAHVHLLLDNKASPLVRTVCGDTAVGMARGRVDATCLERLLAVERTAAPPRMASSPLTLERIKRTDAEERADISFSSPTPAPSASSTSDEGETDETTSARTATTAPAAAHRRKKAATPVIRRPPVRNSPSSLPDFSGDAVLHRRDSVRLGSTEGDPNDGGLVLAEMRNGGETLDLDDSVAGKYLDFRNDPLAIEAQKEHIVQCKHCRRNPSNWRHLFGTDEDGFNALVCKVANLEQSSGGAEAFVPEPRGETSSSADASRGLYNIKNTPGISTIRDDLPRRFADALWDCPMTTAPAMRTRVLEFLRREGGVCFEKTPFPFLEERIAEMFAHALTSQDAAFSPAAVLEAAAISSTAQKKETTSPTAARRRQQKQEGKDRNEYNFVNFLCAFMRESEFQVPDDFGSAAKVRRVVCAAAMRGLQLAAGLRDDVVEPVATPSPRLKPAQDAELAEREHPHEAATDGLEVEGACFYTAPLGADGTPWWVKKAPAAAQETTPGQAVEQAGGSSSSTSVLAAPSVSVDVVADEDVIASRTSQFEADRIVVGRPPLGGTISFSSVFDACDSAATALQVMAVLLRNGNRESLDARVDDRAELEKCWLQFLHEERAATDQNRCRRWIFVLQLLAEDTCLLSGRIDELILDVVKLARETSPVPGLGRVASRQLTLHPKRYVERPLARRVRERILVLNSGAPPVDVRLFGGAGRGVEDDSQSASASSLASAQREQEAEILAGNHERKERPFLAGCADSNLKPALLSGNVTWVDSAAALQDALRKLKDEVASRTKDVPLPVGVDTEFGVDEDWFLHMQEVASRSEHTSGDVPVQQRHEMKSQMMCMQLSYMSAATSESVASADVRTDHDAAGQIMKQQARSRFAVNLVIDTRPSLLHQNADFASLVEQLWSEDCLLSSGCLLLGWSFRHDLPKIADVLESCAQARSFAQSAGEQRFVCSPGTKTTRSSPKSPLVNEIVEQARAAVVDLQDLYCARALRQIGNKGERLLSTKTPGLRRACAALLGEDLDKTEQKSDWSRRPLSDSQLAYAALDAQILLRLCEALES